MHNLALLPLLPVLFGSLALNAQPKKPSAITPEDPEVYYAFFKAHTNIDQQLQSSKGAAATSLSTSTAALYRIAAADLPQLTAEIRKFNVNLGAWYLQQQYYLAQQKAAKRQPDMKVLVSNQWQRQRLVMNAHAGIHRALTKASWTGLYGYINGDFATALHQSKGAGK